MRIPTVIDCLQWQARTVERKRHSIPGHNRVHPPAYHLQRNPESFSALRLRKFWIDCRTIWRKLRALSIFGRVAVERRRPSKDRLQRPRRLIQVWIERMHLRGHGRNGRLDHVGNSAAADRDYSRLCRENCDESEKDNRSDRVKESTNLHSIPFTEANPD